MNIEISKQIIKSVTAVICAVAVCVCTVSLAETVCETNLKISSISAQNNSGEQQNSDEQSPSQYDTGLQTGGEITDTDDSSEAVEPSQDQPQAGDNTQTPQGDFAQPDKNKPSSNSSVPVTKSEILNYCNTALNKVKSSKAGFTKAHTMNAQGKATGVFDKVKGLVTKNETQTVKKGEDSTDIFPAAGFAWSSKLRESDIKSADLKVNGQYYEITLKLGTENNPAKGEASSYGRIMSVIDANDAKEMLPGIKKVNMGYHDGYVYAKIDSKTGNIVKAVVSAAADVDVSVVILGDISAKDIVSTETYTDFVW